MLKSSVIFQNKRYYYISFVYDSGMRMCGLASYSNWQTVIVRLSVDKYQVQVGPTHGMNLQTQTFYNLP